MKLWISAGTVLLVMALVMPFAAAGEDVGWYAGAGFGSSDDDILNESDSGFKMFGGYRFSTIFAVEAAYVDLGEFLNGTLEQSGLAMEGEVTLPLGKKAGLFAKAGFFAWEVEFMGLTDDGTDSTFGVGGKVMLGPKWAIRAEWETFQDISGGDVELVSGSVYYRF